MMFFGKTESKMGPCTNVAHIKSCSSWIDIYNKLLNASNRDQMPKLRPQEVETLIYPNGTHNFGTSSPRVSFLDVYSFTLFLNNKQALEPHSNTVEGGACSHHISSQRYATSGLARSFPLCLIVTQFRGMQPPHLFLGISLLAPQMFISIMVVL